MNKGYPSMRQRVDHQKIDLFLQQLGRRFIRAGRVYLVGGTTMVYEGLRQQTLDIDLAFEVANEDHSAFIAVIRDLKERLSLNIEEASPADFIPLPTGYRERCEYIGRFGNLDVFHFDLYSTALSKIERGTENDFADVIALLQDERIDLAQLTKYFDEILPRFATDSLKQNPADFESNFAILAAMWQEASN
ncbi:MAG: DUF6036 family nucleotidyltransferase [Caldilineaceae bacterium]